MFYVLIYENEEYSEKKQCKKECEKAKKKCGKNKKASCDYAFDQLK